MEVAMDVSENREPTKWRIFKMEMLERFKTFGMGWLILGSIVVGTGLVGLAVYGIYAAFVHHCWWILYVLGFLLLNLIAYGAGVAANEF
jgi:hypothetical protein